MDLTEHLKTRHFDMQLHSAWLDTAEGVVTFPLWNLSAQFVGYQQYRPAANKTKSNNPKLSRYFTWRKDRVVGVWGLESWRASRTLFVTEGVFDACRLTALGYAAVATLSNDVDPSLERWMWMVRRARPVVAVCDADAAGRRLARLGHRSHTLEHGDLGSASEPTVLEIVQRYG